MAHRTESSITIAAPLAQVLAAVADVANYPQWASGVDAATVLSTDDQGRAATAQFALNSGPLKDTYVLEYSWPDSATSPVQVSWKLIEGKAITALDGAYLLTSVSDQETSVTYQLEAELAIKLPGILKRKAESSIVKAALSGLKKYVEQ